MPGCLHASPPSGISSVAHHNPHINVFVIYFLMQELFVNKIHFFKFLSTSDKPWLEQLKIITILLFVERFSSIGNKEGEVPCAKNKYEASATYQTH